MDAADPRDAITRYAGVVRYEARHETPQGASMATEARPARFVDVALLDPSGSVVATGRTDAEGRFLADGPANALTLRVLARVAVRGHDAAITRDELGSDPHHFDVVLAEGGETEALASDAAGDAGAFHVLDTMLRGLDEVHRWTGRTLPPVFAYWMRGGTREWSYYRGERPLGSGRYALELMGGEPGQQSVSDTDEHDEAIILHELGHFVMDRLSGRSSSGGMHPHGVRVDPGLAWEEGRATWFALAVLGHPRYRDTIGVEPWGRLRVDEDLESGEDDVPGLGSETSVAQVLWDLADGAEGLPDRDGDGVALGPAAVLEAMIEHSREEGVFASLSSFLRHLVTRGIVREDVLATMLVRTHQPPELLAADEDWPRPLSLAVAASGTIDGLTQPAPSGGYNLAATGFDAVHTYRIRVQDAGMLLVHLDIEGSGQVRDRTDLDLELLDLRAERLATSRSESARETVGHFVQPGWYIVRVRDGGHGNRAAYRVQASVEAFGGGP